MQLVAHLHWAIQRLFYRKKKKHNCVQKEEMWRVKYRQAFKEGRPQYKFAVLYSDVGLIPREKDMLVIDGHYVVVKEVYKKTWVRV